MTDQPMPTGGTHPIPGLLRAEFDRVLTRQTTKGIDRYGQPVRMFNGRDAGWDAVEEWVDLGVYLHQLRLEYDDIVRENAALKAEIAELKGGAGCATS